jgi:hypothetical protein
MPKATTQSPTSEPDLHTVPPIATDARVDEALTRMTTGAREDGVPAPATVGEILLSKSAPPADASLTEGLPQLADGPALKKRKLAAPAVVSDSISDKYGFFLHTMFLTVPLEIYVGKIGSRVMTAGRRTNSKYIGLAYQKKR